MHCDFEHIASYVVRCRTCHQTVVTGRQPCSFQAHCHCSALARPCASPTAQNNDTPGASRPLKAVMITPGMQLGGAEIWVRTMITHMPAHRVQWQAVLIGHPHTKLDEKILAPIASRTRVIGIRPTPPQPEFPDLVERYESREEASRVALEGADLVICWASGWVLQELLAGFQGPVFAVSHGVCKWTVMDMRSQLSQGATHAVAVSRMAAGACPNPSAVKVLLNGVPPERAEPRRPRSVIRSEWGVDDPDSVLVGYVGRFSSEKNPMAAAAAVSQLPRQ